MAVTILLAAILIAAISGSALAFPDVPANHPYKAAIDELSSLGIIGGYQDGRFGLTDPVKRAQFSKMIVGTLDITPNASTATRFTDLGDPDGNGYPHRFVQTAYDHGITYGTNAAQTLFAPYNAIRRDQVVSMIVRGANNEYPDSLETPPASWASLFDGVPEPHGGNLRIAEYNGLLDGLIGMGSSWNVSATASRGEVAQMLYNLLGVLSPSGVWVYADGSGDYPTIEAAMAGIEAGQVINLGPGIFGLSNTLHVTKPFSLVGNGMTGAGASVVTCSKDVVAIEGPVTFYAEDVSFVSTATSTATDCVYVDGGSAGFSRCGFSGGNLVNGSYGSGLSVYGAGSALISDCSFYANDYDGILVWEDAEVDVVDSVSDGNGDNGIGLYDDAVATIDSCECTNNDWHGISVNDYAQVTVQDSICSSNGTYGDVASGVYFEEAASGTIQNTECSNNRVDGISCHDNAEVTVQQCTCNENGEDGITFSEYTTGSVSHTECSDNVWDGIDVHDDADGDVQDNLCTANARFGIYFGDTAGGVASGNECSYNQVGLGVDATAGPYIASDNYLHNNILHNLATGIVWTLAAAAGDDQKLPY
jgi:parallel beta-helix repeat protein